ncbi:NucA/NucB deoxyribonuclease domain-containing protein [Amycolatopsis sp. ATCC 39116]|uniref:WXG100-like domain-containing protein n=1 Tax=Amycolatopsis TaxID=1813 RepID=UPI00026268D1|nr:NucA/NucB deoxyribonuclease domain-containing protein [Amycolatopsis sp. ATCC 39116]
MAEAPGSTSTPPASSGGAAPQPSSEPAPSTQDTPAGEKPAEGKSGGEQRSGQAQPEAPATGDTSNESREDNRQPADREGTQRDTNTESAQSDFTREVESQAPTPAPPDGVYEAGEAWDRAGKDTQAARDEAHRFARQTEQAWRDEPAGAARERAEASAADAQAVGEEAQSLARFAAASGDEIAGARRDTAANTARADLDDQLGKTLLSPEESELVTRNLVTTTAEQNRDRYAAAAANITAMGDELTVTGAANPGKTPKTPGGSGPAGNKGEVPEAETYRAIGNAVSLAGRTLDDVAEDGVETAARAVDAATEWLADLTGNDQLEAAGKALTPEAVDFLGNHAGDAVLNASSQVRNELHHTASALDGKNPPVEVYLDRDRHKESLQHIRESQRGQIWSGNTYEMGRPTPEVLTVDKNAAEKEARRNEAMRGIPYGRDVGLPGYDRDEFPPAMSVEGGRRHEDWDPSVKLIPGGDNRSAGSTMGGQTRNLDPGDTFVIRETD